MTLPHVVEARRRWTEQVIRQQQELMASMAEPPPTVTPAKADPEPASSGLLVGLPSCQRVASLNEVADLVYQMKKRFPDRTDAECFDMLSEMSSTDRWKLLTGRYDDPVSDPSSDYEGYDPLQPGCDNWGPIEPPAAAPMMSSRPRKPWYDGK
jgi:hypothetical protein